MARKAGQTPRKHVVDSALVVADATSRSLVFSTYIGLVLAATTVGYLAMHRWDPEGILFGFATYAVGIAVIDARLRSRGGQRLVHRIVGTWPVLFASALLAGAAVVIILLRASLGE